MTTSAPRKTRMAAGIMTGLLVGSGAAVVGATVTAPAAHAYPASCKETFTNSRPTSVPPRESSTSSLAVPVTGTVADVDVRLWTDALDGVDIWFEAAASSATHYAHLATLGGGVALEGATFDDEAPIPIDEDSAPYDGRYWAKSPLGVVDGVATEQTWHVRLDNDSDTTRSLQRWSMTITYAGCDPDSDGDGVADTADKCPKVSGAVTGCPVVGRKLTLTWDAGRFYGRITSAETPCLRGREIRVLKVLPGPDRKIGTATTVRNGEWAKSSRRPRGAHYAVAPRVLVPSVGICRLARTAQKSF